MPLRRLSLLALAFLFLQPAARPQSAPTLAAASAPTAVPPLVPYSGTALDTGGKPLAGDKSVTFLIYKEESGGEPLWAESQTVAVDSTGHYQAQLGAASPNGLPGDLFSTGEARWLEAQVAGQSPQPRVLLASVPYALKAGDATTLGGLPASAFALAGSPSAKAVAVPAGITPDAATDVTTAGGTSGYLPVFTGTSTVGNSILYSSATGLGVGDVPNSSAVFDVNGKSIWRGLLNVVRAGNATASAGYPSFPLVFQASAYNSSSSAMFLPLFQLQAEPTGNDTASTGATFNFLYNGNNGAAAETGLYFNANGTIHFAPGQTFPGGTGTGTITGVTAGTGLTGGGTSGTVTLAVDPTKVAELGASNSFAGTQTIASGNLNLSGGNLNLPATTTANSGVITIGGVPFLHGYTTATQLKQWGPNLFAGDGGNFTTTGFGDIGIGAYTLSKNSTGYANTALGNGALYVNTTGYQNTAVGFGVLAAATTAIYNTAVGGEALNYEVTGSSNTAVGAYALSNDTAGSDNTAIGSLALINQSNAVDNTAVGSGSLEANTTGSGNTAVGTSALYSQTTGGSNTSVGAGSLEYDTTGYDNTAVGALSLSGTTTGAGNAAFGFQALDADTTGFDNTAVGVVALTGVTTAAGDTAVGSFALQNITTGGNNTALGASAGVPTTGGALSNTTAVGAFSIANQNNSLILGNTSATTPGADYVNVGIGTATPRSTLDMVVAASSGLAPVLTLTNSGGGSNPQTGIDFNTYNPSTSGTYNPGARIAAISDDYADDLGFLANKQGALNQGLQYTMTVYANGNVNVTGTLSAKAKNFQIDDPLDPENKYLVHTSVESSEMMNIYSGNVTTDELGLATVTLPAWFEAENTDFRYQLTVIGQFAQAIVKDKVANGQFRIMTNASRVEVSWQITAVRQDSYAKAHPLVVEQLKPASERAGAAHPEFGQPASAVDRVFEHPALPEPKAPELAAPAARVHPVAARPAVRIAGVAK